MTNNQIMPEQIWLTDSEAELFDARHNSSFDGEDHISYTRTDLARADRTATTDNTALVEAVAMRIAKAHELHGRCFTEMAKAAIAVLASHRQPECTETETKND